MLRIGPTKVLMMGLLHHLEESRALEVLTRVRNTCTVERIIALDPVYAPSARINNLLCRFDSGNYVRDENDLLGLVERAGLRIRAHWHTRSGNGIAHYLEMCLER